MSVTISQIDDLEEARALHALAFPADEWPGDDHTFWIASDRGVVAGFCSAAHRPDKGYVYFSRVAVIKSAQGAGLGRRLVKTVVRWARREGASEVVTYTLLKNYASMANLLRCGFRFYVPDVPWVGHDVHYFQLRLITEPE